MIPVDLLEPQNRRLYRGSFEEKIQNLIKEVKAAGNVILFFDEIHQSLGAGVELAAKSLAAKDQPISLSSGLSRGRLPVIGATTRMSIATRS